VLKIPTLLGELKQTEKTARSPGAFSEAIKEMVNYWNCCGGSNYTADAYTTSLQCIYDACFSWGYSHHR